MAAVTITGAVIVGGERIETSAVVELPDPEPPAQEPQDPSR